MTETDHLAKALQDLTDHALRDAQASGYSILAEAFTSPFTRQLHRFSGNGLDVSNSTVKTNKIDCDTIMCVSDSQMLQKAFIENYQLSVFVVANV